MSSILLFRPYGPNTLGCQVSGPRMVYFEGWPVSTIQAIKNAPAFSKHISGFYYPNLKNHMSFIKRIKLSNQILHPQLSIFFHLGIRAILVLKMGIENNNFFFIQSFFNKNYQFMPKIVVLEHWDHFFGFLGSFLIKILSFQ